MNRLALAVATVALLAVACTTNDDVVLREAVPEASPGGRITLAVAPPAAVDPGLLSSHDITGALIARTMCDTLIQHDPVTGEPVPSIAESWQITGGGDGLVVEIREDARFHDGAEVTADDVAYTLSRVARPETASPAAELLRDVDGFEEVRGEIGATAGTEEVLLDGVRVIDRFSLEIRLTRRNADFFHVLTHPLSSPIPNRSADENPDAFARRPVCSGPYRLAGDWSPDAEAARLVRVPDHVSVNTGYTRAGVGYADEIVFRQLAEPEARLTVFAEGVVDLAAVASRLVDEAASLGTLVRGTSPSFTYIGLPTGTAPFDLRDVRVAMSQALDRTAIAETVFDGTREPATGFLPPTVASWRPDACGDLAPVAGDPAAARASLASAGVDLDGKVVEIYYNDDFRNAELVRAVADRWAEVFGLQPDTTAMNWDAYQATARGQPGFDAPFRMTWAPEYPSADAYFAPLFDSSSIGQENFTRFSSNEFDDGLERDARRASDPEDRRLAFERLEDLLCGEMPAIPIAFGVRHHLVRDGRVSSAVEPLLDATNGDPILRELFVTTQ